MCLALFATGTAQAQLMVDPTRPPVGQPGAGIEIADDAGGGNVLQSVLISPSMKAAIISGVLVRLGEKVGGTVLINVSESEVVLKSDDGVSQVLKLYPGVDKREAAPAVAKNVRHRKTGGGTALR